MDYDAFVFAAQKTLNYEATNTDFLDIVPRMIEYGEQRLYVEFDFLATLGSQTKALTTNNRNVTLPSNVVVCQSLNVITPAATLPDAGTRNPIIRVGIDYLNALYPSGSGATVPKFYAIIGAPVVGPPQTVGAYTVLLGPTPDQAYNLEVIGTVRPDPLSPTNTTTFLTTYCPELFFAATMIFGAGFQQAFGQQSDNPQLAQSWESQFQLLKSVTNVEQLRVKAASVSWSPYTPSPLANVSRDRANAAPPA